ncbi:MAG: DNA adenine methylase [Planctomycetota bacterium]
MRYLGNKTRLLGDIEECARKIGFQRGCVCDLFAGTSVVGRHFRSLGNRVLSTDLMECSFVFQKVFLELESPPAFRGLEKVKLPEPASLTRLQDGSPFQQEEWLPTLRVVRYLEEIVESRTGLLTRQFSPKGSAGRRYLRPEAAARLDGILLQLREWRQENVLDELELMLLLAAAVDAADRLANISGTYGAFLKSWQSNTQRPVRLILPSLVQGPRGAGNLKNALHWIHEVEADLLYIDPPYNTRQYPANYHLPEVIAQIPRVEDLEALEASLYGKTGLIPWRHRASLLCSRRGSACRDAFHQLLKATHIPRVIISYNEEGIIQKHEFEEMLAEYAGVPRSRLKNALTEISYRRFRSDSDGRVAHTGAGRSYKHLPGRERDEVREWLFHVQKVT